MEENVSLFSLGIDPVNKAHLAETARWAKFLAILGMIFLLLGAVATIFGVAVMGQITPTQIDNTTFPSNQFNNALRFGWLAMALIIFVISFIPLLFLLRFANHLRVALQSDDQAAMTVSFLNLKRFFRYIGIFTLIILIIYALMFVALIVSGSFMR